jgi:hypothetical protein
MVLFLIKENEYRMSIEQMMVSQAIIKFMEKLEPENIFLVFTHCDKLQKELTDDYINKKLASLLKYTKLIIPRENVILFKNEASSL